MELLKKKSATEISKAQNPKGFKQSAAVARKGGQIAGDARMKLEAQTGHSVISSKKASDYLLPENTDDENDK